MTLTKLVVHYGNAPPKEIELHREQTPRPQIEALCRAFGVNSPSFTDYTFQMISNGHYFTDEELNSDLSIPNGSAVNLKMRPDAAVDQTLKALQDAVLKKKALFDLKETLKDDHFLKRFVEKNGIQAIVGLIDGLVGNTLAYALLALQTAMTFDFGWDTLPQSFLDKLLMLSDNTNPNVVKSALRILCRMCESPTYGFAAVSNACKSAAKSVNKQPYATLIALLLSTDVDIQRATLTLINTLTSHAPVGEERTAFLQTLDAQDINNVLKKQLGSTDPEFRKQLYQFQKHKLHQYKARRNVPYDKTNPDHEALLMRLWTATYPDTKLDSRVSEQWKLIGFQGTDPATDFRGMGVLGLEQLLYFAETHTDIFRKIINGQLARKEREYPAAVAGINLTQKLYDLLRINDDGADGMIFPIIFAHKHAFDEMYSTSFQVLDYTWDDMNASYMDFPKVIAAVNKQIVEVMEARPVTLEQFHFAACCKGQQMVMDDADNEEPESVKKLRTNVKKEILEMVKNQKLAYLVEGASFKVLKAQKNAKQAQQYFYCKISDNHQEILWGLLGENPNESPSVLPNVVKVTDCAAVVTGGDIPSFNKKKVAEDISSLAFAVTVKDEKATPVEFWANNREDFANWTDGLRALLGKPMECPETLDEAKSIVTLEMKVRLLELEGVDIPREAPPIPDPPADFDFVELRNGKTEPTAV